MKRNSQAFVNQLLVCLLVTIGFGGSVGMGLVWMRHQISDTAQKNRELVAKIAAVERLIQEKTTTVETELRADALRRLNDEMSIGFVPKSEVPIELVTADVDTLKRLVQRASRGVYREGDAPPPLISITIAQR